MTYTLELITPELREKITRDAGPKQEHHMKRTSFWESSGLTLAIDRESNSYLTNAPHPYSVGMPVVWFYFYFHSKMYSFRVGSEVRPLVEFYDEAPAPDIYEEFKHKLSNAFSIYSIYGHRYEKEAPFIPVFAEEGVR